MRHAVAVVASVAFALAVVTLGVVAYSSPDLSDFARSASTDFAVGMMEVAITVGIVDRLLKSQAEHQHRVSVAPRVQELILKLRELDTVHKRYLTSPMVPDLERYRRVAGDVQDSAFGLYILLSTANSPLASPLLKLSHDLRSQIESVEDAMDSARNSSIDYNKRVEQLKGVGADLYGSGCRLTDELQTMYPPSLAA